MEEQSATLQKLDQITAYPKDDKCIKKIKAEQLVEKYLAKNAVELITNYLDFRLTSHLSSVSDAGTLYVKNSGERKRSYIVMFTCVVSTALHLELMSDMTSDSFLFLFRILFTRRENVE